MAASIKFFTGTDTAIRALTPTSENWYELAFYYPTDKTYFYQVVNNIMVRKADGTESEGGIGVMLNGKVLGGIKSLIEQSDTLYIPENYEYNCYNLTIEGAVNCEGIINLIN